MIVYGVYSDYHVSENALKTFVYAEGIAALLAGKSTIPQGIFYQGQKKASNWAPPAIEWYDDDGRNLDKYKDPDITYCTPGSFILGPRAAELLRPVISDAAELLPIPFQGETWYFMNVFHQIDAVDKAKSRYKIYQSGKVGPVEKIVFSPEKIPHAKLFTIPESHTELFYAEHHPDTNPDTFKNVVEQNKLFGIVIEKMWENGFHSF